MLELCTTICPYCGEPFEIQVDLSAAPQQCYIEDCYVCCRPVELSIHAAADGGIEVVARRDDD